MCALLQEGKNNGRCWQALPLQQRGQHPSFPGARPTWPIRGPPGPSAIPPLTMVILENRQPLHPWGVPPPPSGDTPGCRALTWAWDTEAHAVTGGSLRVSRGALRSPAWRTGSGSPRLCLPGTHHPVCVGSALGGIGPHWNGDRACSAVNLAVKSWDSGRSPPPPPASPCAPADDEDPV